MEKVIEERRLEIQVKVKGNREKGRIKIIDWQKKKMVIPQELEIQKMIQPTHEIITVKSVKRVSNERVATNSEQLWTAALERRAMKGLKLTASGYRLQHQKGKQ